ncbi:MAG: methylmalonyl Co-A mutase-associated GTPase MeaB [Acidimicrobiales bacterium]
MPENGSRPAVAAMGDAIRAGDRRALARGITLVESTRPDHRDDAIVLVESLLDETGGSIRLGISGPPGVGKSTFIEAFGSLLTGEDHRVAVLAVDPSSSRGGGSILGDKTRMEHLGRDDAAFIRPSPSGGELGGVARRTREALLLCEAAGFDVVLVETVGVGQSEIAVADLTDLFVLLASPTGGDDLQGIKRGIMELADLVVVTKADGDLATAARQVCADLGQALHLLRPRHAELAPEAMLVSSRTGAGVAEVWDAVAAAHAVLRQSGALDRLRSEQARRWLWSEVTDRLLHTLRDEPATAAVIAEVEAGIGSDALTPARAARRILETWRRNAGTRHG